MYLRSDYLNALEFRAWAPEDSTFENLLTTEFHGLHDGFALKAMDPVYAKLESIHGFTWKDIFYDYEQSDGKLLDHIKPVRDIGPFVSDLLEALATMGPEEPQLFRLTHEPPTKPRIPVRGTKIMYQGARCPLVGGWDYLWVHTSTGFKDVRMELDSPMMSTEGMQFYIWRSGLLEASDGPNTVTLPQNQPQTNCFQIAIIDAGGNSTNNTNGTDPTNDTNGTNNTDSDSQNGTDPDSDGDKAKAPPGVFNTAAFVWVLIAGLLVMLVIAVPVIKKVIEQRSFRKYRPLDDDTEEFVEAELDD